MLVSTAYDVRYSGVRTMRGAALGPAPPHTALGGQSPAISPATSRSAATHNAGAPVSNVIVMQRVCLSLAPCGSCEPSMFNGGSAARLTVSSSPPRRWADDGAVGGAACSAVRHRWGSVNVSLYIERERDGQPAPAPTMKPPCPAHPVACHLPHREPSPTHS